jgi:hypothetical protein
MREHLEGEQGAWRTKQGYLFKKSGLVERNPTKKKIKKEEGEGGEPKKTAESWLRK